MENLTARPLSQDTQDAYAQFARMTAMSGPILEDLQAEFDRGAFCPENMYITAHALGELRVIQYLAQRMAAAPHPPQPLPENTTNE